MVQENIAHHAVLHIVGEQSGNLRVLRDKVGTFCHQITAKQHPRLAVCHAVGQRENHLIALYQGVPDTRGE